MPNLAGKGIWGVKSDGSYCVPSSIWGVKSDGTYCDAAYAWGVDASGNYVLIWGKAPAAPATAVAAWVNPHSVKVTWTAPAINTNTHWVVKRSDGSIVATVPVGTLTVTDPTPLLGSTATGNKTLAAYTVAGSDGTNLSTALATNTVTWNLDPASIAVAVSYPNATTSTVTVSWTPNATYGPPDHWKVYSVDGGGFVSGELAGTATSFAVTAQPRGVTRSFRAVPFYLSPSGAVAQAGNGTDAVASLKATTPVSLSLTATSSPLSNLRLTWASGGGTVTGYEVQTSTNGSTWAASADDTSPSDFATTVAGYMRVRATSAGGVSDWAQAGPVTPVNDTTPPPAPVITSFKPESSYGRMVVRFTTANVADFGAYRIDTNVNGGAYTVGSWVTANPNVAVGVVTGTYSAGQTPGVRVYYRDDTGNVSAADTASYALVATPKIVDPTDSATWRVDEWRTDGVAGSTGVMHGRTSSGENIGCWFYGEAIQDFVSTHDVVSATLDYCRDGSSQGSGSAIQPQVWVHNNATQPAGAPSRDTGASVLGSGVARSGTTGGSATLTAAMIDKLAASGKGLCIYRSTSTTDPDNAASFYMRLYPFGTNSGGKISGRVTLNHLG